MSYTPTHLSATDLASLATSVAEELLQISEVLSSIEEGQFLPIRASAPAKPRDGMLAVADGTNWNPGGGKGLYEYKSGTGWVKC